MKLILFFKRLFKRRTQEKLVNDKLVIKKKFKHKGVKNGIKCGTKNTVRKSSKSRKA